VTISITSLLCTSTPCLFNLPSCSACRSRNRKFRHDDASENELAGPAREITSRHGVDKRSLLPLAARRDRLLAPERLEEVLALIIDRRQDHAERRCEHIAELNKRAAEAELRLKRL
jgi:hypothetical protein